MFRSVLWRAVVEYVALFIALFWPASLAGGLTVQVTSA